MVYGQNIKSKLEMIQNGKEKHPLAKSPARQGGKLVRLAGEKD